MTVVPPRRQQVLADYIPGVQVHTVSGDHAACFANAREFAPALLAALQHILGAQTA